MAADMNGDNDEVTIDEGDPDPSETLRILVATDNHLGFGEKYPERQNDSYIGKNSIVHLNLQHLQVSNSSDSFS